MEQETPILPPPLPKQGWSRAKGKTRHFPILDLGGGGGEGEYRFPIYFVQDCTSVSNRSWLAFDKGISDLS